MDSIKEAEDKLIKALRIIKTSTNDKEIIKALLEEDLITKEEANLFNTYKIASAWNDENFEKE